MVILIIGVSHMKSQPLPKSYSNRSYLLKKQLLYMNKSSKNGQ